MSKPREFWIDIKNDGVKHSHETRKFKGLHVIEKSAYRKAIAALKKIADINFTDELTLAKDTLKELGEN
jgi:iron uptake system EfeUOB component EfeO/EfeM